MPRSIQPVRVNHINMVLEDFDASIAHFRSLYGADLLADYPQAQFHAGLFDMGGTIFEPFVPPAWLLNARYGPHWLGIEYQADMAAVRDAIADHGIRIARDIGMAVHTHPADTLGVAFEFYEGGFHEREWDLLDGARMKASDWWRDAHPLGLTGLKGVSIVVEEMAPATALLQSFLSAEPVYAVSRPDLGNEAVGLSVADSFIELLVPTGEGPVAAYLRCFGPGIRSTLMGVREERQMRDYFAARGVALMPGDRRGSFAVPAEANLGIMMEFAA